MTGGKMWITCYVMFGNPLEAHRWMNLPAARQEAPHGYQQDFCVSSHGVSSALVPVVKIEGPSLLG